MSKSKMPLAAIPLAGRPRLLPALLLLVPLLALGACGGEEADPEVEIPEEPSDIDNPDLLGYWALVEIDGRMPETTFPVRYQFTAQGDFIRYEGDAVERSRYTFASEDQLTIDGPTGTLFYDYELDGDDLTLREPGEGGGTLHLRKLADQDLEDVPPPSTSVPAEDSIPIDSMAAPTDTTG
jgi:hypothetical protein